MAKVSKFARAKKVGSKIYCPKCNHETLVFHFGWSALVCPGCKAEIGKTDFDVFPLGKPWVARNHNGTELGRFETIARARKEADEYTFVTCNAASVDFVPGYEIVMPVDLKKLFELMSKNDPTLPRWDSLPTFGGIEPVDTEGVWSWDSENMIVGTCSGDIQLSKRYEEI